MKYRSYFDLLMFMSLYEISRSGINRARLLSGANCNLFPLICDMLTLPTYHSCCKSFWNVATYMHPYWKLKSAPRPPPPHCRVNIPRHDFKKCLPARDRLSTSAKFPGEPRSYWSSFVNWAVVISGLLLGDATVNQSARQLPPNHDQRFKSYSSRFQLITRLVLFTEGVVLCLRVFWLRCCLPENIM